MFSRSIVSPDDQKVTFVELFFDLVFVFSVTQVVGLLHHGLSWGLAGQGILVFWLVWWAWTQFTWALNAADTTHAVVQLGTLVATGVAFFMAVAVPDAFHRSPLWFAGPYVLVRLIGLALYVWVSWDDQQQRHAVRLFGGLSMAGLVAVLAGAVLGGTLQYVMWGLAILLDILAAKVGARQDGWNIHPEHFGERHGLFVIIALGETLIVAAAGVTGAEWGHSLMAVCVLAVGVTCALWWSYFTHAKPGLDLKLEQAVGPARSEMARDVFSLLHFPMLCGVIAYAVAIEEAIHHPEQAMSTAARISLALGVLLFVGGMALATWRAGRRLMGWRIILTLSMVLGLLLLSELVPVWAFALVFAGTALIGILEDRGGTHLADQEL